MKVLLIYGGASCEHDISVITAVLRRAFSTTSARCISTNKTGALGAEAAFPVAALGA